jgi:predicted RecA/RadA family phage recombinase
MAYVGQPVPTTVINVNSGKFSDGKSVRVTVPGNTTIEAGKFYLLDGFLGVAFQSVQTGPGQTAEVVLNIEQAEYDTNQIDTAQNFAKGTLIYWDAANNRFTETSTENRLAGRVTQAKDANNVICFILGPQVHV